MPWGSICLAKTLLLLSLINMSIQSIFKGTIISINKKDKFCNVTHLWIIFIYILYSILLFFCSFRQFLLVMLQDISLSWQIQIVKFAMPSALCAMKNQKKVKYSKSIVLTRNVRSILIIQLSCFCVLIVQLRALYLSRSKKWELLSNVFTCLGVLFLSSSTHGYLKSRTYNWE